MRDFGLKYALQEDLKVILEETKAFPCVICETSFEQKSKLHRHFKTHLMAEGFQCDQCSNAFSQKTSLNLHINQVHAKIRD